jgi:organic radical activating enzyme
MQSQKIDKQIHSKELKLRILTTNYCNKIPRCSSCLNDFQKIPTTKDKIKFIDSLLVKTAITQYANLFKGKYPLQVYFSGGETTLHKELPSMMEFAKSLECHVTLNTNGNFSESVESELKLFSDEIHFGTYEQSHQRAERIKRMNGTIQCIYPPVEESFVEFYSKYNIPIKVFRDFYDNSDDYTNFAKELTEKFPKTNISFRHTGIQENRGPGCNNCDKKCITLKAAWIFPDGGSSPCPQLYQHKLIYPKTSEEWKNYFKEVEVFHRRE